MTTDRTTKALLAVIAVSLVVIALNDLGALATARAAVTGQPVAVTNLRTSQNRFAQVLHVRCENCD
jgi:hypothetical protein